MLYDQVARQISSFSKAHAHLDEAGLGIKESVVIRADNVAQYFFVNSPQVHWSLAKDFPNLAPPFPNFWIEYQSPNEVNENGSLLQFPVPPGVPWPKIGLWFTAVTREMLLEHNPSRLKEMALGAKWLVYITPFIGDEQSGASSWGISWLYQVGPNGAVIGMPSTFEPGKLSYMGIEGQAGVPAQTLIDVHPLWEAMCGPALMAICFMHCKNVAMSEHLERHAHHRRSAQGKPPAGLTYHTLEIEPIKRILSKEGQAHKTGIQMAMHICRGHFKTFKPGHGLFGKHEGTYWWESQVRGSPERGEANKDYDVNAPQN